jgi:hypothetical protein
MQIFCNELHKDPILHKLAQVAKLLTMNSGSTLKKLAQVAALFTMNSGRTRFKSRRDDDYLL